MNKYFMSSYHTSFTYKDKNSFDVTSTFTMTTVNLIALDGTTQSYYVYTNKIIFFNQ